MNNTINSIIKPFTDDEMRDNQMHRRYLPVTINDKNYFNTPNNIVYANYYYNSMYEFYNNNVNNGIREIEYCMEMRINTTTLDEMYFMWNLMHNNYGHDDAAPVKVI